MTPGPGGGARSLAVLRRLAEAPAVPVAVTVDEACELCGVPVAAEHRHVVDLESRSLLCACRPCWLLFPPGAAQRYRAVPERHLSFPGFRLGPAQWDALEIPVGLAFFLRSTLLGRVVALYPGPAGAAESALPLGAWAEVSAADPRVDLLEPDVEALFVQSPDGGTARCWLVPVDRCYELVGRLRRVWRGFDGGAEARAELAAFTADVTARSRPAPTGARP
jgi:hypothetical protein